MHGKDSADSEVIKWENVTTRQMSEMVCSTVRKIIDEESSSKKRNSRSIEEDPTIMASQLQPPSEDSKYSTVNDSNQAAPSESNSTLKSDSPTLPPYSHNSKAGRADLV